MLQQLEKLNIRDIRHLCYRLKCNERELLKFSKYPNRYYHYGKIVTKNKERPTATPIGRFGEIVNNVKYLLNHIKLPDYLHGGIKGRSPVTNASCHIGKAAVLNFDLEDFFPSVKSYLVYRLFSKRLGCSRVVAEILTKLVTLNGGVPQGSPTSTVVTNLVIIPLCERLKGLANNHRCDYGQFVDDGAISGPAYIENLRCLIDKIIRQERFRASPKLHKRLTMYRNQEQIVTGVRVNTGIDAPHEKLSKVMDELNQLKATINSGEKLAPKKIRSIQGKIQHIKALKKARGLRLQAKFEKIVVRSA